VSSLPVRFLTSTPSISLAIAAGDITIRWIFRCNLLSFRSPWDSFKGMSSRAYRTERRCMESQRTQSTILEPIFIWKIHLSTSLEAAPFEHSYDPENGTFPIRGFSSESVRISICIIRDPFPDCLQQISLRNPN
jgi:hypothetical protein